MGDPAYLLATVATVAGLIWFIIDLERHKRKKRGRSERMEKEIEKYAEEMAKLSIEFAKKTGYLLLPSGGPFAVPVPIPLKYFPELEKAIKTEKRRNEDGR